MEEQLISFETAKLAKEKGFDITQKILTTYDIDTKDETYKEEEGITQSLLQKWLREEHKIDVMIEHQFKQEINSSVLYYVYVTTSINDTDSEKYCNYSFGKDYLKYEEALEVGLQEALKLIKND